MKQQSSQPPRRNVALCAAALFLLGPAEAADVSKAAEAMSAPELALPPLGGPGGGYFTARCPGNQYLAGVRLRVGDDVDAIQPLCSPYNPMTYQEREYFPDKYGGYYRDVEKTKLYGPIAPYSDFIGGPGGGGPVDVVCKEDVVTGILVGDEGVYTRTVNRLGVFCEFGARAWRGDTSGKLVSCEYSSAYRSSVIAEQPKGPGGWTLSPEAEFEGPKATPNEGFFSDDEVSRGEADQHCPCGQAAVGITGRAGKWLDAVGLICGEVIVPKVLKAQGRVKLPGAPSLPPLPICEAARQARERNSPAAPGLEAQCAAQAPVKAQGRVKLDPTNASATPALSICEAADRALARNSPAARGLAEKCAAEKNKPLPPVDLNALQARGVEIANSNPEAAALRDEQGAARRGFEIGLAAAEWHTAPGPGKQRIHDMLSYVKQSTFGPSEQTAFDAAVAYSLALYLQKLTDLATRGAAIASEDPLSAEFLDLQKDDPARRGFQIGLAAAEGQTAHGPGKQKIRGALPAEEQAGYDTAVAFSIDRNNNPEFARKGALVAQADPTVVATRDISADALYRLGFDIASGLFGDPASGGDGHTAEGPGSNTIRSSLSAAGQRGFDASRTLHFSRDYRH